MKSLQERKAIGKYDDKTLTYGEVTFEAVAEIIILARKKFQLQSGGIFFDLGSGNGKAMVAAALTHDFESVCGIECLEYLFNESEKLKIGYEYLTGNQNLKPVLGDYFEIDWSNADFLLVNSTMYDEEHW